MRAATPPTNSLSKNPTMSPICVPVDNIPTGTSTRRPVADPLSDGRTLVSHLLNCQEPRAARRLVDSHPTTIARSWAYLYTTGNCRGPVASPRWFSSIGNLAEENLNCQLFALSCKAISHLLPTLRRRLSDPLGQDHLQTDRECCHPPRGPCSPGPHFNDSKRVPWSRYEGPEGVLVSPSGYTKGIEHIF
jgi:hypothetical protein